MKAATRPLPYRPSTSAGAPSNVSTTVASGLASLAGFALLDGAGDFPVGLVLAYAAGAVLTMLADTMMPEAFEYGGRLVGLATVLGFGAAFALSQF